MIETVIILKYLTPIRQPQRQHHQKRIVVNKVQPNLDQEMIVS
jgi:hypothetical protein